MTKFSSSLLLVMILMLTITTIFSAICAAAAESTIVSSQEGCINELTEMAVCLPYISSPPPNNLSDEVPSSCCDRYTSADTTGSVTCLCHLVKEACLLGFPINITRIFALSTVCPFTIPANRISLQVQCEAILPNLRPLGSILGSASPSTSIGSPPSTSTLPADEADTNSSLPADEAHTNSSTMFHTHTAHRNFASKFLPGLKWKHFVSYIVLVELLTRNEYVFSPIVVVVLLLNC